MRLEFVKEHRNCWPIKVLCRTLEVTRAAFYKWLGRKPSATAEKQNLIVSEAKRIHALPRHQDYGSPRMHRELVNQGIECLGFIQEIDPCFQACFRNPRFGDRTFWFWRRQPLVWVVRFGFDQNPHLPAMSHSCTKMLFCFFNTGCIL